MDYCHRPGVQAPGENPFIDSSMSDRTTSRWRYAPLQLAATGPSSGSHTKQVKKCQTGETWMTSLRWISQYILVVVFFFCFSRLPATDLCHRRLPGQGPGRDCGACVESRGRFRSDWGVYMSTSTSNCFIRRWGIRFGTISAGLRQKSDLFYSIISCKRKRKLQLNV